MKLYRYVKALETEENIVDGAIVRKSIVNKRLIKALQESKIYFSHPASFNDPLECTIPITIDNYDIYANKYHAYIESILSKTIGSREDETNRNKRIYEAVEFGIPVENCLITCFAKSDNNQLMWSHYADQHQGVCLCYEFPDTREEWDSQIKWSDSIAFNMEKYNMSWFGDEVVYQSKRPSLHITDSSLPVEEWTFENEYKIRDAIFTKPECWRYEQEWRLGVFLPLGSEIAFAAGIDTSGYHAVLPTAWLKEITFGLRLDRKYCDEIVKAIDGSGYNNVAFKKAKMAHGEFRIISEPY